MSSDIEIRWLIRLDLPEVLEIEREVYEHPWVEEDFLCCMSQRNCVGFVAAADDDDDPIAGFMIYELHRSMIRILRFTVSSYWRRQGIGTMMMEKLFGKLRRQRRKEIAVEVRESCLEGQLFLSQMGFRAREVLRGHFDNEEDAYLMCHRLDEPEMVIPEFQGTNRIESFCEDKG